MGGGFWLYSLKQQLEMSCSAMERKTENVFFFNFLVSVFMSFEKPQLLDRVNSQLFLIPNASSQVFR